MTTTELYKLKTGQRITWKGHSGYLLAQVWNHFAWIYLDIDRERSTVQCRIPPRVVSAWEIEAVPA